ncbi:MAG: DNA/RNA non-specific endonuclease, partial [Pseudomonadota bacterium]
PVPNSRVTALVFQGDYIHYTHHSLLFNRVRGFAFVSAHNINGSELSDNQFTSRRFKLDPQIQPKSMQVDNDRGYRESQDGVFGPNPWDRGHLARRDSVSWGTPAEAAAAERESDLWSNIAPQHENLHDGPWGSIEDWMLGRVTTGGRRACVFTGPVFTEDDPSHVNGPNEMEIQIPAGYWKVISIELDGAMRSAGFLVWQRDYDSEHPLPFAPVLEQVRLTTLEVLTGLSFPALRQFDPLLFDRDGQRHGGEVSEARETTRSRSRSRSPAPAAEFDPGVSDETLVQATSPGTSAITSMRDIVL